MKEPIRLNIEKIKQLNPSWHYFLYDDADIESFIEKYYGDTILSFFNRISPEYGAAKADFFRYLVIYRLGGVYLDIKSSMDKPLSDILLDSDAYVLSYWDNLQGQGHEAYGHYPFLPEYIERGEILQWYLIASPGHPLLRKVIATMLSHIDQYNPYVNGVGWTGTVTTTGPVMYTKVLYDALNDGPLTDAPVRWVNIIGDCGFHYSIIENHTILLSSDYRKNSAPLIRNKSAFLHFINTKYLSLLNNRARRLEKNPS